MSWRYRIRKRIIDGEPWYDVVEFYESRHPSWTQDSIAPGGETRDEVIRCLEMMLKDCKATKTFTDKDTNGTS